MQNDYIKFYLIVYAFTLLNLANGFTFALKKNLNPLLKVSPKDGVLDLTTYHVL